MPKSFGISGDTRTSNDAPFIVTSNAPFNQCRLVSVVSEEITIRSGEREGEKEDVLKFRFEHINGTRAYTETLYPVSDDADDPEKFEQWMNEKIAHIYGTYRELPSTGLGTKAKSWKGFFDAVAEAFNNDKDGKPIYSKKDTIWLKLVYSNKGRLQLPFPNFMEVIGDKNEPQLLSIGSKDRLDMPKAKESGTTTAAAAGAGGGGGAMPEGF